MNSVVEITRIIGIDGDDEFIAQILAPIDLTCVDFFGNPVRLLQNISRKFRWQMIFPDDRQHVDARRRRGPEHFNDFALWIDVARFPSLETNHNFIADFGGGLLDPPIPSRLDVHVMHKTWIIGNNIIKIARMLQRSDDRIVCAL